jgi:hypothetical protein
MTRELMKKYLEQNEAIFGYNGDREILLNTWYEIFKDIPPDEFKKAFYQALKSAEFFVKPATVIKNIKSNRHLPVDKAWKVCNRLFNEHIQRDEIMAIKEKYPLIYEIWEDNKYMLNREYRGREIFKELYQEAIYG